MDLQDSFAAAQLGLWRCAHSWANEPTQAHWRPAQIQEQRAQCPRRHRYLLCMLTAVHDLVCDCTCLLTWTRGCIHACVCVRVCACMHLRACMTMCMHKCMCGNQDHAICRCRQPRSGHPQCRLRRELRCAQQQQGLCTSGRPHSQSRQVWQGAHPRVTVSPVPGLRTPSVLHQPAAAPACRCGKQVQLSDHGSRRQQEVRHFGDLCMRQPSSGLYARRYEVELFQKIEALTGQTIEQHSPAEQEVMLLAERVSEAGRIAHMQVSCPA